MKCIYCNSRTQVTNSRPNSSFITWRRRKCLSCGAIFTTHEQVKLDDALMVEGSHGLIKFSRDNLFFSIAKSLGHRPNGLIEASELSTTIINTLVAKNAPTVPISLIKAETSRILGRFDKTSQTYYQAYYASS